jgi:HprK-related kinase A
VTVRISELSSSRLQNVLCTEGLGLSLGPFAARVHSPLPSVARAIEVLYADYEVRQVGDFDDFRVSIDRVPGLGFWFGRLIVDDEVWQRFRLGMAVGFLEWGLNWCVFRRVQDRLLLHAATVERDGKALIMPGTSGSGKSTLCAALIHHGWRLLSDEFALFDSETADLIPIPKPICLKNESIALLRRLACDSEFGPMLWDPQENRHVVHLRPPAESLRMVHVASQPRYIIFPCFDTTSAATLTPVPKAEGFIKAAQGAFNYSVLGQQGFELLGRVIDVCDCYSLIYGDVDAAVRVIDRIAADRPALAEAV